MKYVHFAKTIKLNEGGQYFTTSLETLPSLSSHARSGSISYPEPSNFLGRMLDENEGSGKDQFLGDIDWLFEMQYNTISPLFADH